MVPQGSGPGVAEETPSNAERRYQYAMNWLTSLVPGDSGKTQVEMYGQKQEKYNEALQRKARAFEDAFKQATTEGSDSMKQRVIYEKWVSENQTTYENLVQAAYMEWVTIGRKAEVESYFSVVNIDSPMSRIEASKVRLLLLFQPRPVLSIFERHPCAISLSVLQTGLASATRST